MIYDSHLIMQELGKFNNKLNFLDSYQFLSSSLDSLVKNLGKYGFKHVIQEFDDNVLDLVKQNKFILMNI